MSISLMTTRRFAPLFWCQFFAAFGDNFLKTALVFVILYEVAGANSAALISLAGATLIAPFFFLSGLGGELADRYDKAFIAQRIKLTEIGAAIVAVAGFAFHSLTLLFLAVFMFGTLASLFGPIKYGILPDLLERRELPSGNALIEGGTFLAILLGTIVAGVAANGNSNPIHFAWMMILTALASWIASLLIPKSGEGAPDLAINRNVLVSTGSLLKQIRSDPRLWWGALVASWFWLVGALILSLLPPLVSFTIGGGEEVVTLFLTIFSIAVAIGSGLAAWLAAGRIVLLPTLVAAVLLGVFALDLGWTASAVVPAASPMSLGAFFASRFSLHIAIDLAGLAIAGGLFIVPVFTAVQVWAGADRRARVVAAVNVLNAAFMVAGAVILAVLQKLGYGTPVLFGLIGAANVAVAVAIGMTMPASWLHDFLSIVFRAFFRLEVTGLDNIAKAGHNAIIALNHVSFLDPPLALSILPKRPVFAIDVTMSRNWWIQPFLRFARTMALDPLKPFSLRAIINAVKAGDMLVIFPEGRITVTGSLMKVYDGAALIADKSDAMVVPVRIEGPETTIFSRLERSQVRRRLFPKITVTILEPMQLKIDPELKGRKRRQAAGSALYTVMSDLIFRTSPTDRTIVEALIEAAKHHGPGWLAIEDPVRGQMSYRRLLQATSILGRKLMPYALEGHALGIMLPTSNAAVITLFAIMSAARVPALINFTAGAANVLAACRAAQIDTIVTSRAFVEKGRLENLVAQVQAQVRIVYLEDIGKTIGIADKLRGFFSWKKPLIARKPDDWAAILFTSGSEGSPKGVVLSHRNMLANVAQAAARIDFGREDKLFNVLPVFHSFGLTAGTVLPLVSGVPAYLYPSPLHYRTVPELVYWTCVTECSPVMALNTPMFNKFGSVGRLLPGMDAKLEKVEGVEEGGRLYVKGPNVMLGYLRAEKPGVLEVPPEGWHDTGDIVTLDEQDFIAIKGRAKRFAKVGGEMVSLAAVEMLAAELWPNNITAVSATPDPRKGERLIMVTDKHGATRGEFMAYARSKHASELMLPGEVVVLDKLPMLGSGKVDQLAIDKFVRDQAAAKAAAAE